MSHFWQNLSTPDTTTAETLGMGLQVSTDPLEAGVLRRASLRRVIYQMDLGGM